MASQGGGGGVGGSGNAGAAQRGQLQSLARKGSLCNLTLDEVQSHLQESLHNMNLEELQKSVFPDGLDPDTSTSSQYEQSSGLLRQGSITMPPVLTKRTVDGVWKDIEDAQERNVRESGEQRLEPERQQSLGEMTLEEFLVGADRESGEQRLEPERLPSFGEMTLEFLVEDGRESGEQRLEPEHLSSLGDRTLDELLARAQVMKVVTEKYLKKNKVSRLEEETEKLQKQKDNNNWMNSMDAEPINIQLAVLQDITKNFSDERKIGQGGFGIVYKGVLPTGTVIAIKKLLNSQTIEEKPFYDEATFLMGVRHKNIVRFLGYCANTEHKFIKMGSREKPIYSEIRERLLCFDYMSNGGLDTHLTDELGGLEWHTRYQIIRGICEGLQYLHKKNIVHMDLKPANILLDDYMVPKITDFGISRYLDGVSRYVTKQCLVTLGYCAPEYLCGGEVSLKVDIFSLGAIIRDVVTGRKQGIDSKNVLRRWRYRWNRSGKYPPLGYQQISKCIEIARSCLVENPKLRPYIWEINIDQNEEEKTNDQMTNPVESMVGQINPYPWELLEIEPLELNFPFKPNKQIQSSIELHNDKDDYIAFKIQKPSIQNYIVEPDKGIMAPHSSTSVTVTFQASNRAPDGILGKENFVVRCAIVDDGLTAANSSEDVFDTKLGEVVDEVMLTVAFT